jgi:hypothetical protein
MLFKRYYSKYVTDDLDNNTTTTSRISSSTTLENRNTQPIQQTNFIYIVSMEFIPVLTYLNNKEKEVTELQITFHHEKEIIRRYNNTYDDDLSIFLGVPVEKNNRYHCVDTGNSTTIRPQLILYYCTHHPTTSWIHHGSSRFSSIVGIIIVIVLCIDQRRRIHGWWWCPNAHSNDTTTTTTEN